MKREWAMRGFHVLLFIAIIFGVEGARLAWLQLGFGGAHTASGSLARSAFLQRSDGLMLDSGRGQFRDRNGRLLTGKAVQSLAAFPDDGFMRGTEKDIQRLADSLGVNAQRLESWLTELREPEVWKDSGAARALELTKEQIDAAKKSNLLGVSVLPFFNRYPADYTPIHAIGYISQHPERVRQLYGKQLSNHHMNVTSYVGGSGLEKSLDRVIQGIAPTTVMQVTDAARRPLEGLGLRMTAPDNPHFPLQVTTTLDLGMQRVVEEVMSKYGISKGAAVVLDAANADIRAMVSLPRLDPYHIGAKETDERNHALTAAPPGSVFKVVTLAAAIESGVTTWDEMFHCNGHYGKYGLKCWREEGHGVLTLEQAFAESCNVVFAELAERMDPAWLQITAERMGLGRQIGWSTDKFVDGKPLRLLEEEEAGSIFMSRQLANDGGVRTGTGIGQRDVRVTPLQAANMAVTILHNGHVFAPRLVKEIRYADGGLMTPLEVQSAESKYGHIGSRTAALLREGMRSVVLEGTAAKALKNSVWPLAGKSGTAELAGKQKARNDQWFIGYGPVKGTPHYAIAVLIEDQPAGLRNRAAAVFGAIMDGLCLLEQQSH
ncbi:peptidoglycan D,D-transpeptidase FtsI family protein [Cohnella silvisoli]|uniref:Penicillin-binding transpeptidase domain-containing protein n=1 Tax=Cohnella silvisoli TaxID=2873699 RepID=A0ABV1KUP5_9BACL|nr:penicillin-binding transpeptidase domain-containing protein [Cohnella silvisoli]MCD9023082.1 penicillin-binding protein [Cohnella silvisoli]